MLHTLSTLSQDEFMVLLWIAICASVALVTVAYLIIEHVCRYIGRARRMARIVAGG